MMVMMFFYTGKGCFFILIIMFYDDVENDAGCARCRYRVTRRAGTRAARC